MKAVLSNTKRFLAVFLALAMVVLTIPDTALFAAERYRAVTNEETGETEYMQDENGDLVFNEETGEYDAYVEEPADPADPQDPTNPDGDTIILDNGALGAPAVTAADVTYSGDSHVTVSVFETVGTEEVAISNGGLFTIANAPLVVRADFATGYAPATNDPTPVTYYQIGETKTAITLEEDAVNGGYKAELDSLTFGTETAITIKVASAPVKYYASAGAVVFDELVTPTAVVNGVDETPAVHSTGWDVYYNNDFKFKLSPVAPGATITGVSYFVGTAAELEAYLELPEDERDALPVLTADASGVYKIGKEIINTLEGDEDTPSIFVLEDLVVPAKITVVPDYSTVDTGNDVSTPANGLLPGVKVANSSSITAAEAAAIQKTTPVLTTYGKDLVYTFILADGYASAVATTAEKTTAEGTELLEIGDPSISTKGSGASAYRVATFTIPWSEIEDATALNLAFKGVTATYTLSFGDKDNNITSDSYSGVGKAAGGEAKTFTLTAKEFYEVANAGLAARIEAAEAAENKTDLFASGIYAIDASVSNKNLATNNQVYKVVPEIAADKGSVTWTITNSLAATGIASNLKIYLGDLTRGAEAAVTLTDDGAGIDNNTEIEALKGYYGEDLIIPGSPVALKSGYKLLSFTYAIGGEAQGSVPTKKVSGATKYYIPGSAIKGDIALTAVTVDGSGEAALKIIGGSAAAVAEVVSVKTAYGTEGSKNYTGTASAVILDETGAEAAAESYAAVTKKNGGALKAGDALTLTVTLKDADYMIDLDAVNVANAETYLATRVTASGKVFTITGSVLAEGYLTIPVSATGGLKLTVTDNDASKVVSNNLYVKVIPVGVTEEDEIAALPFNKITSPYSVAKAPEGTKYVFRHKAYAAGASYEVVPGAGLTKDDAESTTAWTVYNAVAVTPGTTELTLATNIVEPDKAKVYLFNADSANVTKVAVTADQTPTDATKETYLKDYLTNASSTKSGVYLIKEGPTTNGYMAYSGTGITRTSTAKVDPKNLVVTFTVAANYEPVVTAVDGATLKTSAGATFVSGVTDTTKAVTYVWTMAKTKVDDGDTLTISTQKSAVANAIVVTPTIADSVAVTASVDGKAVAVTDNKVTAKVGEKVLLTVAPAENYSLVSATNLVSTATSAKESTIALKPKGFQTTITIAAGTTNTVNVTTIGDVTFQALTGGETLTKAGTAKTAVNTKTKQTVTSYTYDALIVGTTYVIPKYELAGEETSITSCEVTPDAKDSATGFTVAGGTATFKIGEKDAGTTFKLAINGYDAAYNVKAAKVLTADGITVKGTTKSGSNLILKQEIGTCGLYTVSPASGMSLKGITVSAGGTVAALATDPLTGEVVYDKNGAVTLIVNTVSKNDTPVTLTVDTVEKSFTVKPDDSKLTGTKPTVTLKSATSAGMVLNLALPSAVSSNTLKKLATGNYNLFYEVTIADGTIDDTQYYLVDGANQNIEPDLADFVTAGWEGGAKDFTVTAKVYLLNAAYDAAEDNIIAAIAAPAKNLASSDSSDKKVFATKDLRFPATLRVNPAGNKLYAGQNYTALTTAEVMKSGKLPANTEWLTVPYDNSGDVQWVSGFYYVLGNVLPDSAATVPNPTVVDDPEDDYAYTIAALDDSDVAGFVASGAFVYNGKLMIPVDALDVLADTTLGDQSGMIQVTAPAETTASEGVSATLKITLEQRAVYWFSDNPEPILTSNVLPTLGTQTVVKKNGTAATVNLGIEYPDGAGKTKASLNKYTYALDLGSLVNITKDDLTVASGKVTVAKDYVFPAEGTVSFTVTATSDYNPDACVIEYEVTLVPAEGAKAQGEAVLATTKTADETTYLVGRNGAQFTNAELESILEGGDLKVIYLLPNAVIPTTGEIAATYIVDDTNIHTVSGNAKLLAADEQVAAYNGAAATATSFVLPATETIGRVTLTATAENTGTKKALSFTIVAGDTKATKTESPAYTIEVNGVASAAAADPTKYAAKNETIEVESTGRVFEITVKRGVINLATSPVAWKSGPGALDDYYTASQLKAGAGTTILESDIRGGRYRVVINGKSGKVAVNGVTYTIENTAKADAVSAGSISHTDLYANYGYEQTVTFTASNKSFVEDGMYAVLSPDYTVAGTEKDILDVMDDLGLIDLSLDDTLTLAAEVENDKAVFELELATAPSPVDEPTDMRQQVLPKGSFNFYVTYVSSGGDVLTEPAKATLTIKDAPKFTAKTSYSIDLQSSYSYEELAATTAVFQLTDSTGKKTAKILGVSNVYVNGLDNEFTTMVTADDTYWKDGILVLADNDALLKTSATKTNCTGLIAYTTDNVTTQYAKVTLSFTAGADVTADAIEAGIGAEADAWSVQDATAAKALTKIKSLVNVPSGVTLSFSAFDADKNYTKEALLAGDDVRIDATLKVKKGSSEVEKDLTFTIPSKTVGVASNTAVDEITYSLKDGANNTVTAVAGAAIPVLNGAVLTVTKVTADEGYKPDNYSFTGYGVEKLQKSANVSFGEISKAGAVTVKAMNTITLKKGANVTDVALYVNTVNDANLVDNTGASKSSLAVNVETGSTLALTATNAKGYDVAVKETVTKKELATTGEGGDDVDPKTFTFEEEATTYVLADIHAARTFDASASAHLYGITPNLTNADDVVTIETLEVKKGSVWGDPEDLYGDEYAGKIPVAFGSTTQFRFYKEKQVNTAKAGNYWTLTTVHDGTALKDSTANAQYATYTTAKLTKDNTGDAIYVAGQQNSGLTVTYSDKANDRAISDIKLVAYDSEDTSFEHPIADESMKLTSGKELIVPAAPATTVYRVEYGVKQGWRDYVAVGEAAAEETTDSGVMKSENYALEAFEDGNIQAFTLTAKKDTKIGIVDLSKLYNGEVLGDVFTDTEDITYTWNKGKIGDTFDLGTVLVPAKMTMDPVTNKQTITITVTTKDGYDLSLLTYKAGATKPTAAKMTLKSTNADTKAKTWTANVAVTNDVAFIGFQPTAQSRTITVTDTLATSKVNSVYYYTVASTAKKTGRAGVGANTTITAPYGSTYTVCFTTPKGVESGTVALESTGGDYVIGVPTITGDADTTGLTYTYLVRSATATGTTSSLKIVVDEGL